MMTQNRGEKINKIKALFLKIKAGHNWMQRNPDDAYEIESMLERAEELIYPELEELGVSKDFSRALLIFGPYITESLVRQFDD